MEVSCLTYLFRLFCKDMEKSRFESRGNKGKSDGFAYLEAPNQIESK